MVLKQVIIFLKITTSPTRNIQLELRADNINTKFINNYLDTVAPSGEYTLATSSALKLESNKFSSDVIRGLDSSSIPVSISKSGIISVKDGTTTKTYNTDTQSYSKTLTNNAKIIVTSSSYVYGFNGFCTRI